MRANIGLANRYLHYKDIEYFKEKKYKIYDFGGISKNKNEDELNIAKFKQGFGGRELFYADYISVLLWVALKLKYLNIFIGKINKK
jgi:lipid II:glycine glycyltransferase (peptidoglycan interpeptide bridge formation enzyme)